MYKKVIMIIAVISMLTGVAFAASDNSDKDTSPVQSGWIEGSRPVTEIEPIIGGNTMVGTWWRTTGDVGTTPGTHFLGTTDNQALQIKVNNQRVYAFYPHGTSPNIVGGYSGNFVLPGEIGGTISGGGSYGNVNSVLADFCTIGGGRRNSASDWYGVIGGGYYNAASGYASTIAGGYSGEASGDYSALGGGYNNEASGYRATVSGGSGNVADDYYTTISGGLSNQAGGQCSAVPGGYDNEASGSYSFAGGCQAKANHWGSFVWGDGTFTDIASTGNNEFIVRASGGIWFGTNSAPSTPSTRFINTSTGAYLSSGGTWTNASDKNLKEGFEQINEAEILEKVAELPITIWNYREEASSVTHIGPVAQDFHAAFGLGNDDRSISTVDADGVALAAIQALYAENQEKEAEIAELRSQLAELEARFDALEKDR